MDKKPHILIVDESSNIEQIITLLEGQEYQLSTADSNEAAWQRLINEPDEFGIILLNKVPPKINGPALIAEMKKHGELHCTVILQTDAGEDEDAGAQYYLTKPLEKETLLLLINSAIKHQISYKHRVKNKISLSLLTDATFKFKTVQQAHALASLLSDIYPEPLKVITGLTELMLNAVEHGNLAINYSEKTALIKQGLLSQEIQSRLELPEYKDRDVTVYFQLLETIIEVTVIDQGAGFEWEKYMEFDTARLMDPHGRGIAISNKLSFDELEYKGSGNEVVARLYL